MSQHSDKMADFKKVMPHFLGHSLFVICLIVVIFYLFYQYRYGENGLLATQDLQQQLAKQQYKNELQAQKNARLAADVNDLKSGVVAIEEHARVDLGLIKPNETFVQISASPVIRDVAHDLDPVEVVDEAPLN